MCITMVMMYEMMMRKRDVGLKRENFFFFPSVFVFFGSENKNLSSPPAVWWQYVRPRSTAVWWQRVRMESSVVRPLSAGPRSRGL